MEMKNGKLVKLISFLALLALLALIGAWLSAGSVAIKARLQETAMNVYEYFAACAVIFFSLKYILGAYQKHGTLPLKQLFLRIAAIPLGIVLLIKLVPPLVHDLINIFILELF